MIERKRVSCGGIQKSMGLPIPFEATPGNSDIQSHPEHIHMQIDSNEEVALGHLA